MENTSVIYVKMSLKAPTYILVHYIFVIIIPLSSNIWHRYSIGQNSVNTTKDY